MMHIRRAAAGWMILLAGLAGCGGETPAPGATAPAPATTISATTAATETASPPSDTATVTVAAVPYVDIPKDLPYLQDGGFLYPDSIARIGIGDIQQVSPFPDGKHVLVVTSVGVFVYRVPGFERAWRQATSTFNVSLSPRGDRIVASNDRPIDTSTLYDAVTGSQIAVIEGFYKYYWSADGHYLAVFRTPTVPDSGNPTFLIYDASTGQRAGQLVLRGYQQRPVDLVSSPNGNYVAACPEGTLIIWRWDDLSEVLHTNNSLQGGYCPVDFSPDGHYAALDDQGEIRVFDLTSRFSVLDMPGKGSKWGVDHLYVWDDHQTSIINPGDWSKPLPLTDGYPYAWESPRGNYLALTGDFGALIFDTHNWQVPVKSLETLQTAAKWSADEHLVMLKNSDVYEMPDGKLVEKVGISGTDYLPVFIDAQTLMLTGKADIALVNLLSRVITGHRLGFDVQRAAWTLDSRQLVFEDRNRGGWWAWSANSGKVDRMAGDTQMAAPITLRGYDEWRGQKLESISPDGVWRLSSTSDIHYYEGPYFGGGGIESGTMKIYRGDDSVPFLAQTYDHAGIVGAAWTADSHFVALAFGGDGGALAGHVVVMNPLNGEAIYDFAGGGELADTLLFSPDGQRLVVFGTDGTISIWNTAH